MGREGEGGEGRGGESVRREKGMEGGGRGGGGREGSGGGEGGKGGGERGGKGGEGGSHRKQKKINWGHIVRRGGPQAKRASRFGSHVIGGRVDIRVPAEQIQFGVQMRKGGGPT